MRASVRNSVLALAMTAAAGGTRGADDPAPIPREGTSTHLTMGSATMKRLDQGKDQWQLAWEFLGVVQGDDGKGLTHNASVRCVGSAHAVPGVVDAYTNACAFTRPDGDQLFTVEKFVSGKPGGASQGTYTIVGGTGKLAGITGSGEWSRYFVRPAAEGTGQTVTRGKTTYRLP
jgi:hypothetical protein